VEGEDRTDRVLRRVWRPSDDSDIIRVYLHPPRVATDSSIVKFMTQTGDGGPLHNRPWCCDESGGGGGNDRNVLHFVVRQGQLSVGFLRGLGGADFGVVGCVAALHHKYDEEDKDYEEEYGQHRKGNDPSLVRSLLHGEELIDSRLIRGATIAHSDRLRPQLGTGVTHKG